MLDFIIYPNPSNGKFEFNRELNSVKVSIYSVKGNLLINEIHVLNNSLQLDLPPSSYFLKLDSDQGVFVKKIIIQ